MASVIRLPNGLQRSLDAALRALLTAQSNRHINFAQPLGEQALAPADSVSWRIFKNPVALFIGGIAAVILELAEPAVRAGVWNHSSFRRDPLGRLQRTGLAAMVTVYGPRSVAQRMIERVARLHSGVVGMTSDGGSYAASDPQLLAWVHTTAAFSFGQAYSRYAEPLGTRQMDQLYLEGAPAAHLYGVLNAPASSNEVFTLFESMRGRLQASPVVFEFLQIMRRTPAFPRSLIWLQPLLIRAAIDIIPDWVRHRLGLDQDLGLGRRERWLAGLAAELSNRILLPESPAVQSCVRLGLSPKYLYR